MMLDGFLTSHLTYTHHTQLKGSLLIISSRSVHNSGKSTTRDTTGRVGYVAASTINQYVTQMDTVTTCSGADIIW